MPISSDFIKFALACLICESISSFVKYANYSVIALNVGIGFYQDYQNYSTTGNFDWYNTFKAAAQSVGGYFGAKYGAAIGAAIGTKAGPVGQLIGAGLGGIGGGFTGYYLGGQLVDYLYGK